MLMRRVCSQVHVFETFTADTEQAHGDADQQFKISNQAVTRTHLRKLRNNIYARIEFGQSGKVYLERFKSLTKTFISKHATELSVEQLITLKTSLERTEIQLDFTNIIRRNTLSVIWNPRYSNLT